jgi:hypothetical protein
MKSHYLVLAAAILSVPAMVFAEDANSTLPQKTGLKLTEPQLGNDLAFLFML